MNPHNFFRQALQSVLLVKSWLIFCSADETVPLHISQVNFSVVGATGGEAIGGA